MTIRLKKYVLKKFITIRRSKFEIQFTYLQVKIELIRNGHFRGAYLHNIQLKNSE